MRATNVVRFLQEKAKIDPTRLVAAGRGPYEPVAPNDTPEGLQKNRRIEIMLIDRSLAESLGKTAQN
jgi:chemotaxis protein MotB